jgi:hypothetical protein
MRTTLFVLLASMGCYSSGESGRADDAGITRRDASAVDPGRDGGATEDASAPIDVGPTIPEEWVPITEEQAECLGLTDPACASCHIVPGTDEWVLRPGFAPSPPPLGDPIEIPPGCLD